MLVARALHPDLRARLAERIDFEELPFVRGRTVVPTDRNDLVIAGHPNHLGVFDLPTRPWIAVTGRWSNLRPAVGAVATIETEPPVDRASAEARLTATRQLAKQLGQLSGVTIAFSPQSPVLIALFPVDPVSIGLSPLRAHPELPGGARIELDRERDATQFDPEQYAHNIGRQLEMRWRQPPER